MSSSEERKARSFVERHGLWNDAQFEAAASADKCIEERGLEVVRLSFPDQHGILRGKTVLANEAAAAMRNGCSITTTLLAKDTAHKTVFPVFTPGGGFGMAEMEGGGDFLMVADPTTMASRFRSRPATFIAARWSGWPKQGSTTSPASKSSFTSSSSMMRGLRRPTPPGQARRRKSVSSPRATSI